MKILSQTPSIQINTLTTTWLDGFWEAENSFAPFWRFYHNDRDGLWVSLNGKTTQLSSGRVYLIPPCTPFARRQENPVSHFYIHFTAGQPYDSARPHIHALTPDSLMKEAIASLRHVRGMARPQDLLAATYIICASLLRLTESEFGAQTIDSRVVAAINEVVHQPQAPLNIEALAKAQGLSRNAFIRLFRGQTGETPHRYLMHMKLDQGRVALEAGSESIEQIADRLGFVDRFHFSREFKKVYRRTPAAHRKAAVPAMTARDAWDSQRPDV